FFLSTILECQVTSVNVLPQEFSHRTDREKTDKDKDSGIIPYSMFRVDFMATVRNGDGRYGKILIEVQKSLGVVDVERFRQYLGQQYSKKDSVVVNDGVNELVLPITAIYILGTRLANIKCSCLKVERRYRDVIDNKPVSERDDFIEKLTHDSYFIQVGRIKNNRYSTHLEKLLSIFEQSNFVADNSEVLKEYRYNPDVEEIKIITGILHEMGSDPEERKRIENEAEFIRTIDATYGDQIREQAKTIEEQNKSLEEKTKSLEEQAKTIDVQAKENAELKEKLAEMERLLRDKQIILNR
ncbi:MAG: hypothetical protein LBK58_15760, partial [Prevotellaceae bacterium]|nr:hypothetical protein [Prevotellaceae bacterium]